MPLDSQFLCHSWICDESIVINSIKYRSPSILSKRTIDPYSSRSKLLDSTPGFSWYKIISNFLLQHLTTPLYAYHIHCQEAHLLARLQTTAEWLPMQRSSGVPGKHFQLFHLTQHNLDQKYHNIIFGNQTWTTGKATIWFDDHLSGCCWQIVVSFQVVHVTDDLK